MIVKRRPFQSVRFLERKASGFLEDCAQQLILAKRVEMALDAALEIDFLHHYNRLVSP